MPDIFWTPGSPDGWQTAFTNDSTIIAACGLSPTRPGVWRLHYRKPYDPNASHMDGEGWVERVESTAVSNIEEAKATVLALWRMAGSVTQ